MKKPAAKKVQSARPIPPGMQKTKVVSKARLERDQREVTPQPETDRWNDVPSDRQQDEKLKTFNRMEMGAPDDDLLPDRDNPQGAQGGRGPLNQEGEGNRQNDQIAELEAVEPDNDD